MNSSVSQMLQLATARRRVDTGVNPGRPKPAWGSHGTRAGAMAFLADAVGFVWEMTEQTGARVASPYWHQRFVPTNPVKRATVKHAAPRSHHYQHGTV